MKVWSGCTKLSVIAPGNGKRQYTWMNYSICRINVSITGDYW